MKDYYRILQVSPLANINDIKKAYRKKAFLLHPDKNPSLSATQLFKELNEAYHILSDPEKRKQYDLRRQGKGPDSKFTSGDGKKYGTAYKYPHRQPGPRKAESAGNFKTLENWMFFSLLFIGILAIIFSINDLITQDIKDLNGFNGILFGLLFTFLLIYSWTQIYRKKNRE